MPKRCSNDASQEHAHELFEGNGPFSLELLLKANLSWACRPTTDTPGYGKFAGVRNKHLLSDKLVLARVLLVVAALAADTALVRLALDRVNAPLLLNSLSAAIFLVSAECVFGIFLGT